MAAGEDQPQAVIDDRAVLVLVGVLLAIEPHQLRQPICSIRHRPVAAHPIDRPPPRGDREPCARLGGDAVAPPRADRVGERVLHGVLRQLKVAHMPDQRRQHRRALRAERRRDGGADRIRARAAWRLRRAQDALALRSGRGISSSATIGRTSTDPYRAQRQTRGVPDRLVQVRAIQHVVAQSTSLVTANGPSVNSVSSPRTRTVVALSTE